MVTLLPTHTASAATIERIRVKFQSCGEQGRIDIRLEGTFVDDGSGFDEIRIEITDGGGNVFNETLEVEPGEGRARIRVNGFTVLPVTVRISEQDGTEVFQGTFTTCEDDDDDRVRLSLRELLALDGRANPDPGAPVIIYIRTNGDIEFYGFDDKGSGFLAFVLPVRFITLAQQGIFLNLDTDDTISVITQPILIRSYTGNGHKYGHMRAYLLPTNEIQVNIGPDFEGKTFVYVIRLSDMVVLPFTTYSIYNIDFDGDGIVDDVNGDNSDQDDAGETPSTPGT
jgi:hypothetical protein